MKFPKKSSNTTDICDGCNYVATALNPLVRVDGQRIHKSHLSDKLSKFYKDNK